MSSPSLLFSSLRIRGLTLKNRITMAPLFLGYANPDGTASRLIIDHYREMASSGVAMVVVENAAVDPSGSGNPFVLRLDDDRFIDGISKIAGAIHDEGAIAFLQINHAGRYAYASPLRIAPSAYKTDDVIPLEMTPEDINAMVKAYADAARRVKQAGFDGVEIHGGTGYLVVQFLSSRTNLRKDNYGGPLANRMRFPLEVVDAVISEVGAHYPVGYRFLADEWLPDGLHVEETSAYACELGKRPLAYLSVTAGTYDSFFLPEYQEKERHEGYMVHFAHAIKKAVQHLPVIAAGRVQTPETAENILRERKADLVGLARVLFADPSWPKKAAGLLRDPIIKCEATCSLCMNRVMKAKPAFCARWEKTRRETFLSLTGE